MSKQPESDIYLPGPDGFCNVTRVDRLFPVGSVIVLLTAWEQYLDPEFVLLYRGDTPEICRSTVI